VKKLLFIVVATTSLLYSFAQDSTSKKGKRDIRREEKRQKVNDMIKQEEEGVLVYKKQSIFGVQLRSFGYGFFYETGKMKSQRNTTVFNIGFSEIKHPKEDKLPNTSFFFGNPYIYGKINNFYQLQVGFGQQRILGQKGNKNGVAVSTVYSGGLSFGLLRPYYIDVDDNGITRTIKYTPEDSALFVGGFIFGSSGLGKGWGEMKFKPGAFAKTSLRFDYGRFNEVVSGIEVGVSLELYSSKIPVMLFQKEKQFYLQGYIALLFGRRR